MKITRSLSKTESALSVGSSGGKHRLRGNTEELFEEQNKYDDVFNESAINRDLGTGHVALSYVAAWTIDQLLLHVELPDRDKEYRKYSRWFVLSDLYQKLSDWKQSHFSLSWQSWIEFLDSDYFENAATKYAQATFRVAREMVSLREEARAFFRRAETAERFARRTSPRMFNRLMNKAYKHLEREGLA